MTAYIFYSFMIFYPRCKVPLKSRRLSGNAETEDSAF